MPLDLKKFFDDVFSTKVDFEHKNVKLKMNDDGLELKVGKKDKNKKKEKSGK
jgi:putative NADPH-quinone reductase